MSTLPNAGRGRGHQTPAPATTPRPPRLWKQWLVLVICVYPVILALASAADPWLSCLPLYGRFAVLVPILVAVMVWVIVPRMHRHLGPWLRR